MRFIPDSPPGDRRPIARKPPQRAERLLSAHLGVGPRAESILGDLREEYDRRLGELPRWIAALWYWVAAISLLLRLPRRGSRRPGARQLESLLQDVRFGVRALRASPAFTATAVGTLAIGIGATIAVFSVANGIVFRPLSLPEPDRVAVIQTNTGGPGWYGSSQPEFMDFQEGLASFESLGIWFAAEVTLEDSIAARRTRVGIVSSEVLPLLGVPPVLGRLPTAEEDLPGAPRVAVIAHETWQREFAGESSVVGRSIGLAGQTWEIIGVMPAGFTFPEPGLAAWLPIRLDPANPVNRANHNFPVVGRLRPGVAYETAASELELHTSRIRDRYPENYAVRGYRTRLQSLHERTVGEARAGVLLLLGGAVLVMLVACVNVSNLSLARGDTRRTELAVRGALGAGRGRVTRQLLVESAIVATVGGLSGLALGWAGLEALIAIAPDDLPRAAELGIDGTALLASAALVVSSICLFGLGPAVSGAGESIRSALVSARSPGGRRRRLVRRVLVVSQLSLAGVIAIAAGTMVRTLANLYRVDPGFDADRTLVFRVSPSSARYTTPEEVVAFHRELVRRLEAIPGVVAVGGHSATPLGPSGGNLSLVLEEEPDVDISAAPDGFSQIVTEGYFEAMGIELRSGRLFSDTDQADTPPVAVINESLARVLWPGQDPIGRRFRMFGRGSPFIDVIGVVADVRHGGPDEPAEPRFYVPHAQAYRTAYFSPLGYSYAIRATADPAALAAPVRAVVSELDPLAPVSAVGTMQARVTASLAHRRFVTGLLQTFGIVALVLAAVGVYGVMSLAVSDRTRELGLRKALGARGAYLVRMVLRDTLVLAAIGGAIACLGGVTTERLMRGLLYEASATDPFALLGAGSVLAITALLAAAVPAVRAARVDPMEVLKTEN